jgi:hypothetical protein
MVVGRAKICPEGENFISIDGAARCSRRHGVFALDSNGFVRYMDLDSCHGSLLVPLRGAPRRILPRRPVALWPGDVVAIGGPLPLVPTASHLRTCMTVFRVEPSTAAVDEAPSPTHVHPILHSLSCTVCQEVMRGARVLPCGHAFCEDCILRWFRTNASCPTCRAVCDPVAVAHGGSACTQLDNIIERAVEEHADEHTKRAMAAYATMCSVLCGKRKR